MSWGDVCCFAAENGEGLPLKDAEQESPGCVWRGRKVQCKPVNWSGVAVGIALEIGGIVLCSLAEAAMPAGMPQPPPFVGYVAGAIACSIGVGVIAWSTLVISKVTADDGNYLL